MNRLLATIALATCVATGAQAVELTPVEKGMIAGVGFDCAPYGITSNVQENAALEGVSKFRVLAREIGEKASCEAMLTKYPNHVRRDASLVKPTVVIDPRGGPITGKKAKFDIVGRIVAVVQYTEAGKDTCDLKRFNLDEVARVKKLINTQEQMDAEQAGANRAYAVQHDAAFCDQLYTDAGNWSMLVATRATKDQLRVIMFSAAVENNDCNWNEATKSDFDPAPYPTLARDGIGRLASEKAEQVRAMLSYSDETVTAQDEGFAYGTSNLKKHCPIIEKYAATLVD